jgi:hypothetical protein
MSYNPMMVHNETDGGAD